jgi:hypothetical protein
MDPCAAEAVNRVAADRVIAGIGALSALVFDYSDHPRLADFSLEVAKGAVRDAHIRIEACERYRLSNGSAN